ncbi:ABC transporter substrate-binding protein [Bradyrhizobium cosmicum]|nr:ABC transporter substrate-binding protein [Bradyrhizobium cosmicum]
MDYYKGQFVGFVQVQQARLEAPVPRRWYLRQCMPGKDARVVLRLATLGVSAWSPTIVRYIDRRTRRVAAKPHLGRRIETPFLPGLIFVPDFELHNPATRDRSVKDLGDYMRLAISGGGRIARASDPDAVVLRDDYQFATLSVDLMAQLRDIVNAENGARIGRGHRGPVKYKPGDKIYIVDGSSQLFAFEAEVKRGVDSKGRLKAFIAALMGGVSVDLSETQVEPA